MYTNKSKVILLLFFVLFSAKLVAQQSLGDPVFNEDFGYGTNYTPVGPPLKQGLTTMQYGGGGRCASPGHYLVLNSSDNCYDGTFRPIGFDNTGTNPFGYLMMVNGDNKPVIYYTYRIKGDKFCPGANYQFAVFLSNIYQQMPRPDGYVDPDVRFTVNGANGATLANAPSGAITNSSFQQYHIDFIAPSDGSDVVITLSNNALTGTIGNDFIMDDITVKPYGPVIDIGFDIPAGPQAIETTQCLDKGAAKYYLKALVHNYVNPVYQWQSNINNQGWNDMAGKIQDHLDLETEFQSPQIGKYQYRLGALSGPGVPLTCRTYSETITINVVNPPQFSLPAITTVCEGDVLSIHADRGSEYYWTLPDHTHSTDHYLNVTLSANQSNAGIYTVVITDKGCSTTTSTEVRVYPPLAASVDNVDLTICAGEHVQLGAKGGTVYKWDHAETLDHDDIAKPIASPLQTTEYHVTIGNGGCAKQRVVTVKVLALPEADAGKDFTMQETVPVKLNGNITGDNVNFYWTPNEYIDDPTSRTPTINPPETMTYTLHVESLNNCGSVSDEVSVRVLKKITIPTTFTPNNDGINDTWKIDKLITYPESTLKIYTRDGLEVFKTTGDAQQWNGIYNGKVLPVGVYYYIIDLKNNLPKRAGWVMLLK